MLRPLPPRLSRFRASLDPDHLLDAIHTFMETSKEVREARDATSLHEAQCQIECGLIRGLTEIALQAARIVKWTGLANKLCDELRSMRDLQTLVEIPYRSQHEVEIQNLKAQGITASPASGTFELEKLSQFNPEIYSIFLDNLNNLITLFEHFKVRPLISIATQAIFIGKQACALANILYNLISLPGRAGRMRVLCHWFTHRILLSPMLHNFEDLVSRIHSTHTIREQIWEHLSMHGYTSQNLDHFRKYALFVVKDLFPSNETDEICAYALLNHDVMDPFPSLSPDGKERCLTDCEVDFRYPFVVIQHLFVRAPYRRCGIGGGLVRYIAKMAKLNGYQVVSIEETDAMLATRAFWNAVKFKPSHYCQGWYERGIDDSPQDVTLASA